MPLHVGDDRSVGLGEVVGIFDHAIFTRSKVNGHFLRLARSEGRLLDLGDQSPGAATVVLTRREVILSPLSHRTLARRAEGGPLRDLSLVQPTRRKPS